MKTENIEGLSLFEINILLQQGGRFVMLPNLMTKSSTIYFVRPEEKIIKYSLRHFLKNLKNALHAFPLSPFYAFKSLFYLAMGGKVYTHNILVDLKQIDPVYNANLYCLQYV